MREYRVFYLLLYIVSLVLGIAYQSRLTAMIFVTMSAVAALTFLLFIISALSLKIEVRCDKRLLRKNEAGKIKISVNNRFFMPLCAIKLNGRFPDNSCLKVDENILLVDSSAFSSVNFDVPVKMRYRGQYKVGCASFELYDLLGIFKYKRKLNCLFDIVVLARDIDLVSISDMNEDDSNSTVSAINKFNNTVFSSLREYKNGDTFKQIHWKLSAKQGELISKELEQPLNNSSVIFADFTYRYSDEETAMRATDTIIETLLALNKKIIFDKNTAENFWQDSRTGQCESFEVAHAEDYTQILYTLSLVSSAGYNGAFSELVELYIKEAAFDKSVYFIIPVITEGFIEMCRRLGFITRKDVVVVTIGLLQGEDELYQYMLNESPAQIKKIDEENIVESFL